jgi:hypothetical protein
MEKQKAVAMLLEKLEEGERSGREEGWLSEAEVDAELGGKMLLEYSCYLETIPMNLMKTNKKAF